MNPIYWHSVRTPANRRIFVARVNLEPRLDGYEITSLCVSKSQRGKGYGSAILRKVIDDADEQAMIWLAMSTAKRICRSGGISKLTG